MRLLLAAEAAALLRLSDNRVYELAKRGLIPCVRIGRQIRFPEDKLLAWIEAGGSPLEAHSRPALKVVGTDHPSGERR
jgi:excisionase family DNA binding protein